ncbi:hypothetical protein CcaCcLH18_00334 [Colletotrichum camelliae]|nr:hypothetical protein CcaCcLH18_00334 [Colletotrichum camelliae]
MPAPYSDNLYSADDSDFEVPDDDLDVHLSPTDGYFQSSSSSADNLYPPQQEQELQQHQYHRRDHTTDNVTDATLPTSAGVPHVPNVLVQDPSLQQQQQRSSKKDSEAREETRLNTSPHTHNRGTSSIADDDYHYDDGFSSIGDSVATPSHTTTYTSHAQSSSSYTPYSPSTDTPLRTPQTHPRRSLFSHTPSLFNIPREAPPAYTPSPTSPLSSSSPREFRNYQTFSPVAAMGAPEEARHLLGRDPESMGGDEPYQDDERPLPWKDRVLKKFPWASRRTLKMVLFALLMFSIFVGFLSMLSGTSPSKEPAKNFDPVTGLPIKDGPEAPAEPSNPTTPSQPGSGRPGPAKPLPWRPQSACAQNEHRFETRVFDVGFDSSKGLSVLQTQEGKQPSHGGYQPDISGDIVVRRQLSDSPGPSVELEVVGNDERLNVEVEWDAKIQQLRVKAPAPIEWSQSSRPCMAIRATVWVPADAELNQLTLAALHLGVRFVDDLAVSVKDTLEIGTYAGDVRVPGGTAADTPAYRLDARNIVVHTISGDIAGGWPLFDSLKIRSESGDIAAAVQPKPVLESRPLPAVLEVSSVSGDVFVKQPLEEAAKSAKPDTIIPPRNYITSIDTKSGMIRAWAAFSTGAVIDSVSGDVGVTLLPVYDLSLLPSTTAAEPELQTKTKSGNIAVTVLEPLWVDIAKTLSRGEKEKERADPNLPVDIPTNPLPVPDIPAKMPRIPHIPNIPFIPIGARDPYRNFPGSERRWSDLIPKRSSPPLAEASSSSVRVAVAAPPPMRHLKSEHDTISGNLKIVYPASWEGAIEAKSVSGDVNIRGQGVKIDSRVKWPQTIKAHKGQAWTCSAHLSSVSGNEELIIGPEA